MHRRRLRQALSALAPAPAAAAPAKDAKALNRQAKAGSRASVCWGLAEGEGSTSPTLTQADCDFFAANGCALPSPPPNRANPGNQPVCQPTRCRCRCCSPLMVNPHWSGSF